MHQESLFRVMELDSHPHDRKGFDGADPVLNHYLRTQANQDMKAGYRKCLIGVDEANHKKIYSFFTLYMPSVKTKD
ncbi:MAG: hypothetical protein LUC43_05495 [Burkholderiales bacterium]|nr:hypothetical protein [Burkholderiales bacterium]